MSFDMLYGAYIWSAYGVSAAALLGATTWTLIAWRAARARLAKLEPPRGDAVQEKKP